ncbi:hypothetical protein SAMN05661008_01933 [Alkalithermobacter thermoalcaliphilus JW-YL-7 = DSM 7308]|uniref:ATP/GTP-binding protein n=1 Tax=Alkalithermobacter thermoalcaliphilus JW-YL-7 = DSM 7308 TaxID=1121328 RepID=A0A150FPD2_CLOPD|nr:ATP/GTP-binding protein [[Clostridium] paradoxum JW-YL-7 = DSM 7308]SHL36159.1 hypothetical protein SAMN05661008_01933 [[Clostridium] paradoxum JW-YL-7 = DSM 7308]
MIKDDKRIRIIIGHYGSGKTEFAINYVMKLRNEVEGKVAIADLDVVNVYFRTREKRQLLESNNIIAIDASVQASAVDVPAVSAQVMAPLQDESFNYVMDVGGDSVGARALARFSHLLKEDNYDMFFIVNANREKTSTAQDVIEHIKAIERTTNLKVTGLVNNTHLIRQTTLEDILKGQDITRQVSQITNIPIRYVTCIEHLVDSLPEDIQGEVFPIKLYMREEWM